MTSIQVSSATPWLSQSQNNGNKIGGATRLSPAGSFVTQVVVLSQIRLTSPCWLGTGSNLTAAENDRIADTSVRSFLTTES